MESQNLEKNIERDVYILKRDYVSIVKEIESMKDTISSITEVSYRLKAIEENLAEYKQNLQSLTMTINKIESRVMGTHYERDIEDSRKDRHELWEELERLKGQMVGMTLDMARNPSKPETWWNSRVSEWTAKLVWISLGGIVAWAISVLTEKR